MSSFLSPSTCAHLHIAPPPSPQMFVVFVYPETACQFL